jgi:hypothetical protein
MGVVANKLEVPEAFEPTIISMVQDLTLGF